MNRKTWFLGYLFIFLGMYALDQSTKLHTQKNYMAYSDPADSQVYENTSRFVWGYGNSPTKIRSELRKINEAKLHSDGLGNLSSKEVAEISAPTEVDKTVSKNWVDFELTYVRNHGAVWGIFSNLSERVRLTMFYTVTFLAVFGVAFMFVKSTPEQRIYRSALAFILAGAIGNFTDRVMLKYVIDWIHFQWSLFGWDYSFPVFNVADISIDIGIGLMLLDAILQGSQQGSQGGASQASTSPDSKQNLTLQT
jgi:lipoprotein signal peptidase